MRISDWSSDVCSSDLHQRLRLPGLSAPIVVIRRLLVGLVALHILHDQPGAVAADAGGIVRLGEEFIELGVELVAPAEQPDQPQHIMRRQPTRSEERRVGKEWVSQYRTRCEPSS